MISHEEARARVARGAAHLDTVRPGWFNRIDTGTLTLRDPCYCIVGQLCGSSASRFTTDAESLGGSTGAFGATVLFGFDANFKDTEFYARSKEAFKALQDAWIEAIADRRLAADIQDPVVSEPVASPVGV